MQRKRPTGVTIIGALDIIGGIIMLILGAFLIVAAAVIPNLSSLDENAARQLEDQLRPTGIPVQLLGPILGTIAGIMIAIGIASIVVAIGLLKGKGWAWTLTMVLSFIGIAVALVEIAFANFGGIANLVINGVILYYLFRPNVKAYFGRAKAAEPTV
jgi:hypothetical protein